MEMALLGNMALFLVGFAVEMGWLAFGGDGSGADDTNAHTTDTDTLDPDVAMPPVSQENAPEASLDQSLFATMANGTDLPRKSRQSQPMGQLPCLAMTATTMSWAAN